MIVEFICLACASALAITGSLTFWKVTEWYHFYIPLLLAIAGYLAGIAISWIIIDLAGRVFSKKKFYKKPSKWARWWLIQGIWYINHHALIKLDLRGKRKINSLGKQRFVLVCNHRSKFDSMLLTEKFGKKDIAFITKQSNVKIPLGGRLMCGCSYLPVNRDDKLQSLEQFRKAESLIANDASSIGVFPEGTRQQAKTIGDFHEGVFNIAIHTKAPIVVVTTKGTDNIHKRFPRFTKVRMDIVCVLKYEDYQDMPAKAVSDMVHEIMEEHLLQIAKLK